MELTGKKAVFLGDSITEGVGTSAKENIYLNVVSELAALREAKNFGISGTRIAREKIKSESVFLDWDFQQRALMMDKDADLVFVFGGWRGSRWFGGCRRWWIYRRNGERCRYSERVSESRIYITINFGNNKRRFKRVNKPSASTWRDHYLHRYRGNPIANGIG